MSNLRILSLLPAATEIVYLLGLEKYLVGVSHECDYPKQALKLPKITSSPVSDDLSSLEINNEVAKLKHKGSGVFHIDEQKLKELKPNLILTQELCDICAISWTQVKKAARILSSHQEESSFRHPDEPALKDLNIISLEPESINDILENILTVGKATGKEKKAKEEILSLRSRMTNLKTRLKTQHSLASLSGRSGSPITHNSKKPKVLIIEWLDPLMVAGHWVPEMVEKAGGVNLITSKGQKSYPITIDQIIKAAPDILIFAPCGFDIKRTLKEKELITNICNKIHDRIKNYKIKTFLMDGNAYLTRPGPRIIDGVEILTQIFHLGIPSDLYSDSDWINFN